jgi:hypothetical protein
MVRPHGRAHPAGKFNEIDAENVAEEIDSLGKSERHQLRSRVAQILEHQLKLSLTAGPLRENDERGWRGSIRRQQGEIRQLSSDSPRSCALMQKAHRFREHTKARGTKALAVVSSRPVFQASA